MKGISEFFEASARFDKIVHLPSAVATESLGIVLEDFFFDLPDLNEDHAIFKVEAFKNYLEHEDEDELVDELMVPGNEISGFIVKLATPVCTNFSSDGSSWIRSWGYYSTEWAYASSWEEAENILLKWAEEQFEKDKAKALQKQKEGENE